MNKSPHRSFYATQDRVKNVTIGQLGLKGGDRLLARNYLQPTLRTLELGCGTGRILFGLEKELGFQDLYATDFVFSFVASGHAMALQQKSSVRFCTCDATHLPFCAHSTDQVVCLGVLLSHLPKRSDRLMLLGECRRVLRSGGVLLIDAMNQRYAHWHMPILKAATFLTQLVWNPHDYPPHAYPRVGIGASGVGVTAVGVTAAFDPLFFRPGKPRLYYYTEDELFEDLVEVGFRVVRPPEWHPDGITVAAVGYI